MSLMFFLSGLFVPSSLARKGSITFLSDRFFRIGLPLVLVVVFLMPVTYYPTYLVTAADPSVERLLATSDGAAVLAVRPAVVPVATPGAQRAGGRAASLRARDGAKAWGVWRHRRAPIRSGSLSRWSRCRRWLTCRWL